MTSGKQCNFCSVLCSLRSRGGGFSEGIDCISKIVILLEFFSQQRAHSSVTSRSHII